MASSRLGTIEIHSRNGIIRLRCMLDGAELVVDRQARRLFDDRTTGFYGQHSHAEHLVAPAEGRSNAGRPRAAVSDSGPPNAG